MPSRRIVSTMLLVAMGLQAFTPDPCDLSSSWLLILLASTGDSTQPTDFGLAPIHVPGSQDHDDGGPGELCIKIDLAAGLRARHDVGDAFFLTAIDRSPNVAGLAGFRGSIRSPSAVDRGVDDLIPVLCRFLC